MSKKNKKEKNSLDLAKEGVIAIIYLVLYTITFILMSKVFKSFIIDDQHLYLYSIVAVLLISILNITIRPVIVKITMPFTALSLGLFYFAINMFILKIVEWTMGGAVRFTSLPVLFIISILFSIANFIINDIIVKPIKRKVKNI